MQTVVISEPHLWGSTFKVGGHHYAEAFLRRGWQVIFLSNPIHPAALLKLRRDPEIRRRYHLWSQSGEAHMGGRLITYTPFLLWPTGRRLPSRLMNCRHRMLMPSITHILKRHGVDQVQLLWLNGSVDGFLLDAIPHQVSLMRVSDNYAGFSTYPEFLIRHFHRALKRVDVVIATSQPVCESLRQIRPDIEIVRNGVDFQHFAFPKESEPPDLRSIEVPRAIYVGAISDWFDWDLLKSVARRLPFVQFVIVGPLQHTTTTEQGRLGIPENVHLMGARPYSAIPAYLAHSQVAIVPFRQTSLVDGVSPIKVYEYLAAGLPVVSTKWQELESARTPAFLVNDADDFAEAIRRALSLDREAARNEYQAFASEQTWENRFRIIMAILENSGIAQ